MGVDGGLAFEPGRALRESKLKAGRRRFAEQTEMIFQIDDDQQGSLQPARHALSSSRGGGTDLDVVELLDLVDNVRDYPGGQEEADDGEAQIVKVVVKPADRIQKPLFRPS